MIDYNKGAFSVNLLGRIYGSAIYRAMFPGFLAFIIFIFVNSTMEEKQLYHPKALGVLVGSISLVIVFRANHSYSRYWEACGHIFGMMSWWLDTATHISIYHLQSENYREMRPPSYQDNFHLNELNLTRHREHAKHSKISDASIREARSVSKSINKIPNEKRRKEKMKHWEEFSEDISSSISEIAPDKCLSKPRLDGGWGNLFTDKHTKKPISATYHKAGADDDFEHFEPDGFASCVGGRTTSLYIQELAHLVSLLSAVALSTLRNDIEGAESPLGIHYPGSPMPEVDPGRVEPSSTWEKICQMMGADRTAEALTYYNAAHPIPVIGGVSDAEILFLQKARGPYAKVQLAWHWLSEFIIRESKAGSGGPCGDAIMSRIMQFVGSGMARYNSARKILLIPFPYVHAQLSVFFILCIIPAIPYLMIQYTKEAWVGGILSFLAVTCIVGIHEVARELESPFRNVPNEIPLVTLQAQMNEGLYITHSGFHPDHYFDTSPPSKISSTAPNKSLRSSVGSASIVSNTILEDIEKEKLSDDDENDSDSDTAAEMTEVSVGMTTEAEDDDSEDEDDPETIVDIRAKLDVHAKEMKTLRKQLNRSLRRRKSKPIEGDNNDSSLLNDLVYLNIASNDKVKGGECF